MKLIDALKDYRAILNEKHIGKRIDDPLTPSCSECQRIMAVDALIADAARPEVAPKITRKDYEHAREVFCGMADVDTTSGYQLFDVLLGVLKIERPE